MWIVFSQYICNSKNKCTYLWGKHMKAVPDTAVHNLASIDKNDEYLQLTRKVWFWGGEGVKGFAQIHSPQCGAFCLRLLTILSSSVKWKPHVYQGSPCLPLSLETFIHGDNGHIQGPVHLSSHPLDPHSFPPSSQLVLLLLHVFFGVQVLCSHRSSVFMAVTTWSFPGHGISWPSSFSSASHIFLLLLSLVFLGLEEELKMSSLGLKTQQPLISAQLKWPAAHLCLTCHPLPKESSFVKTKSRAHLQV